MQESIVQMAAYPWFFTDEKTGLSAAQVLLIAPWRRQNAVNNNNASGEYITFNNKNSRFSVQKY